MPYARNLEERVLPSPARVIATVRRLLGVEETVGAPVPPARVQRGGRPSVRMPVDVTMPKLSDTMEEGKILKWLKHPGERVAIGEIIAEVETDKANMELEAYDEGTLAEVRVQEGESAPVGAVIAVLAAPGEGAAARPAAGAEKGPPPAKSAA